MLARRIGRALTALLIAAGLALAAFLIIPALLGWERYVIVSGSMTGTYDRGSLVMDEVVPVASLRVGDVITYRPPRGAGPEGLVTHRISSIGHDPRDKRVRVFRTKGDANEVADPWTFTLPEGRQARVVAGVPYAGHALAAFAKREVRMILIGFPAALIALFAIAGLWREAGEEAAAAAQAVSGS
jgi:signal peptidase